MTAAYDRPTEPNAECAHPETTHRHGTNACYTLDGCRCRDCRDASSRAWREWIKQRTGLKPSTYVDAEPVRRHLLQYIGHGMSTRRIAELTGVPNGAIGKLIYGVPNISRPPSKKITRRNAERLLACPYSVADGARVDATEALAIIDEPDHKAMRVTWRESAACRGHDSDLWFPGQGETTTRAQQICRECPVQAECLDYALATHQKYGIWGGATYEQRLRIRRRQKREQTKAGRKPVYGCGTEAGYKRHIRRGETPCEACREASRRAAAARRAAG